MPSATGFLAHQIAVPLRQPPKYEVMLPQIVEMTEAGSGVDLISRALGVGAEVVREAHATVRHGLVSEHSPGQDVAVRPPLHRISAIHQAWPRPRWSGQISPAVESPQGVGGGSRGLIENHACVKRPEKPCGICVGKLALGRVLEAGVGMLREGGPGEGRFARLPRAGDCHNGILPSQRDNGLKRMTSDHSANCNRCLQSAEALVLRPLTAILRWPGAG